MAFFYIMVLGIAAYGGAFVKIEIAGIPLTYIFMALLAVTYINYFIRHRGKLKIWKSEICLIVFVCYGLLIVLLSAFGVQENLLNGELLTLKSYIFRQAYYLYFLPLIIVMADEENYTKYKKLLEKYRLILFWGIYLFHIIYRQQLAIGVPTVFILAYLSLQKKGDQVYEWLGFIAVMFTPIAIGGELTNLFIRLVYAVYYLIQCRRVLVTRLLVGGIGVALIAMFVAPFFSRYFSSFLDANSYWRLQYWQDELFILIKSKFLGVGFGTAYASTAFVGDMNSIAGGPFAATSEYTVMEKLFATGAHNSFISLAFRLGVVGIVLFLMFFWMLYVKMRKYNETICPATFFIFFSSILIISFNVGLESPYYLMLFIFAMGISNAEVIKNSNRNLCLESNMKS